MKRIGIVVVAYNAASTLAQVLDRIPRDFVPHISGILVCDNRSEDSTYLVGLGYKQLAGQSLPLTVIRQDRNMGYGGNQKTGYRWAIEQDFDIAVLLHADGQYAPEFLPKIVAPLERGEADAVFGSRMMVPRDALKGGMPLYKFVGNRILTTIENRLVGTELSEWHSGYRAYSVATLRDIPFERNSDDYDFDTGIILQLHDAGKHIVELPIPTYYGNEISYVNGMRYAKDIVRELVRYRANKLGMGAGASTLVDASAVDGQVAEQLSARAVQWLSGRGPGSALCLAGTSGLDRLREGLTDHGQTVVAVDLDIEGEGDVQASIEMAIEAQDRPSEGGGFDVVVATGALERCADPVRMLASLRDALRPEATVVVSIGNVGHWYPRAKAALGRFDYEDSGILDRRKLRLFTRASLEAAARRAGFAVRRAEALGATGADRSRHGRGLSDRIDALGVMAAPRLFGAHWLVELSPSD